MNRENLHLSDGRNLEYLCNGAIKQSAIILHAGTTQDITGWQTWLNYFSSQNVFALAIGRSGYAGSSKKIGRITIDIASDVAELSSALGITKFVNIGLSGGGQHAIATGLDPRSAGVVTIGSLAPYAELGKDFYTGMQQADLDEYSDAVKDINLLIKRFQSWQNQDLTQTIGGAQLIVVTTYRLLTVSKTTFLLIVTAGSQLVAAIYPAPCASGAETVIKPAAKTPAIPKSVNMAMIIASRFENNAKVLFIKFTKAISGYLINFITALPMPNYARGGRAATI